MIRYPILLGAVFVLLGCQRPESRSHDEETRSISAETAEISRSADDQSSDSAAPPAADVPRYTNLKAAAAEFASSETNINKVEQEDGSTYLDLIDCSEEDRARDPSGAATPPAEALARRVALLERSLREAGYPADIYLAALTHYESTARGALESSEAAPSQDADRTALKALASDIDRVRQSRRPDLPPVRAVGGCGAAESPTVVRSDPGGGRVWMITRFAFDVCKANRIDPWDRASCGHWSEMDPAHPSALSGEYVYQARWPDGASGRGTRRIAPGDDSDTAQVYLVRKD